MLPLRPLGQTGYRVSPLGLTGSFGIDADATERAFHDLGVNYFWATSSRAEGLTHGIRRLVENGQRDRMVIGAGVSVPFGWSVGRELRKAQKQLGVERIDVFHLFWVQAHWYVTGNTWKEMRKLRESGAVGALAISIHDRPLARKLIDELELDAVMLRYNAAHRGAEREIFATLDPAKRPGIVAYTATRWGKLLQPLKDMPAMSAPECYRFALAHPMVDTVLCGARSFEELAADAKGVSEGPLTEPRLTEVRKFGDAVRATFTGKVGWAGA